MRVCARFLSWGWFLYIEKERERDPLSLSLSRHYDGVPPSLYDGLCKMWPSPPPKWRNVVTLFLSLRPPPFYFRYIRIYLSKVYDRSYSISPFFFPRTESIGTTALSQDGWYGRKISSIEPKGDYFKMSLKVVYSTFPLALPGDGGWFRNESALRTRKTIPRLHSSSSDVKRAHWK